MHLFCTKVHIPGLLKSRSSYRLNFYSHITNNGAAKGVLRHSSPVTEKYNANKDFFRFRMRSTSSASQDWEVLQAVVGFAFTIQQEYLRLRRDTSAMLDAMAQQAASVQAGYPAALQRIIASAHNLTEASGAAIALGNEQGMVCVARSGASSPPLGSRLDARSGLSGECIRTREPVICMNAMADPRVDYKASIALGIKSMVYRPILNNGKLIGVLAVFSSRPQHFSYRDLNCLKWTDELISEALQGHDEQVGIAALIKESFVLPDVMIPPLTAVPSSVPLEPPIVQEKPRAIVVAETLKAPDAATVVVEPPKQKEAPTFVGRVVDESVDDELPSFDPKEETYDSPVPMLVAAIMVLAFLVVVGVMSYYRLAPKLPTPKAAVTQPAPQTAAPAVPQQVTPTPAPQDPAVAEKPEANPTEEVSPDTKPVAQFPSGLSFDSTADKATLNIALKQPITYQGFSIKSPERLYFDLKGAALIGPKGTSVIVNSGLVSRIRISLHSADTTRIVFDLREPVDFYAVQSVNPQRLTIELHPKISAESSRKSLAASNVTIVIDPGHGGHDQGAISESGLMEKDVTLDLAQRLGALLEKRLGAKVVYTRTTDDFVSLPDRVTLANNSGADFMISIHGNSSSFRSVRGLETYYFKNTQEALALAADATRTAQPDGDPDAARSFAADVHRALLRGLDDGATKNRGLKSAPFVVLRDAHMPAVLAEVAFISSRKDAKRLESSAYRDKVAKALYQGIANHVARRDGRILSATNLRASTTTIAAR